MSTAVSMYTYINEFAAQQGNGKFPNIPRAEVVAGLKARMATPHLVDQSMASLCGPASLAYMMLKHLPAMYAAYIMSLYDKGSAMLGRLLVEPSEGCRNARLNNKISAVDWVGLASLRDSENAVWEYNSPDDAFAGITMPGGLEDWLNALRMTSVKEETNLVITKGTGNLKEAANLYAAGYAVALFVNGDIVTGNIPGFFSSANHWVVLSKYPQFSVNDMVSIQVFSWGKLNNIPPMKRQDFLKGYYGYVAGKWR